MTRRETTANDGCASAGGAGEGYDLGLTARLLCDEGRAHPARGRIADSVWQETEARRPSG